MSFLRKTFVTCAIFGVFACSADRVSSVLIDTPPSAKNAALALSLPAEELAILDDAGITVLATPEGGHSTTGGVWYVVAVKGGPFVHRLAFSAIIHHDGAVSGQYEYRSETGDVRIHGDVNCLTVSGNSAKFSGPGSLTKANGTPEATSFTFFVVDNGEGSNDPPDMVTGPFNGDCNMTFPFIPTGAVDRGNLQVH